MAALRHTLAFFLFSLLLQQAAQVAKSQSFIGVNYGQVADNLPPPAETARLLTSTAIQKVRLYGADPAIIKALANTGIGIAIGAANGDIPALAADPNFAKSWIGSNVLPFYPASNIILINVGNEVMSSGDRNLMTQLLPAMQNLQNALDSASIGGKIKVSTVHSMAVLTRSDPPSSGSFDPSYGDLMKALLGFNSATGSPFTINPYPFFAYQSDPRPETLAFCLFQPNSGRVDSGTNIKYMNMFDAQVDAVRSALNSMGGKDVEIVIAETGWPYKGDSNEVGTSVENAKAYNGNLIAHLRSMVGTPLMPGKSVDTYLFALYDEDLKPGPASERSFGLFKLDLTMTYDAGLSKSSQSQAPSTPRAQTPSSPTVRTPATPSTNPNNAAWCVPKASISDAQLQENLDYVCGHGIDCSPIQPGGACFEPATLLSHATYAMNLLYQTAGRNPWNCDFSHTATLSSTNPNQCFVLGEEKALSQGKRAPPQTIPLESITTIISAPFTLLASSLPLLAPLQVRPTPPRQHSPFIAPDDHHRRHYQGSRTQLNAILFITHNRTTTYWRPVTMGALILVEVPKSRGTYLFQLSTSWQSAAVRKTMIGIPYCALLRSLVDARGEKGDDAFLRVFGSRKGKNLPGPETTPGHITDVRTPCAAVYLLSISKGSSMQSTIEEILWHVMLQSRTQLLGQVVRTAVELIAEGQGKWLGIKDLKDRGLLRLSVLKA
ncbi:hypothetical protein RJ640_020991 [Escallonia rubra]|uniref:glucan endo-1,3-beta-D-glucosidase n=1 Tax=Escallonia rubra TaxID=112253 RepID=A0AA88UNK9_9ASTE|nr:hypothetical protein RJ640_020991 [Escallonia rubra]